MYTSIVNSASYTTFIFFNRYAADLVTADVAINASDELVNAHVDTEDTADVASDVHVQEVSDYEEDDVSE